MAQSFLSGTSPSSGGGLNRIYEGAQQVQGWETFLSAVSGVGEVDGGTVQALGSTNRSRPEDIQRLGSTGMGFVNADRSIDCVTVGYLLDARLDPPVASVAVVHRHSL